MNFLLSVSFDIPHLSDQPFRQFTCSAFPGFLKLGQSPVVKSERPQYDSGSGDEIDSSGDSYQFHLCKPSLPVPAPPVFTQLIFKTICCHVKRHAFGDIHCVTCA